LNNRILASYSSRKRLFGSLYYIYIVTFCRLCLPSTVWCHRVYIVLKKNNFPIYKSNTNFKINLGLNSKKYTTIDLVPHNRRLTVDEVVKLIKSVEKDDVKINSAITKVLAQPNHYSTELHNKTEQLKTISDEMQKMEETHKLIETKSVRHARFWIWTVTIYCVIQISFIARLTWYEFSWDIMEPITWGLSYIVTLIGASFFLFLRKDYTWPSVYNILMNRKRRSLRRKYSFDPERFTLLTNEADKLTKEINSLSKTLGNPQPTSTGIKDRID